MPEALVEFHAAPGKTGSMPRPYPAMQVVPEWYKQMPPLVPSGDVGTVKRCAPFLDAMTFGYIIPLPVEMHITYLRNAQGAGELDIKVKGYSPPMLDMHPQRQVAGAPFANMPIVKFLNPWIIKTPPGYSTLFVPPMNRFAAPIVPLCGVVETDRYYQEIHFPSVWLAPVGQSVALMEGTPLVQVIPIRREAWNHQIGEWDEQQRQRTIDALAANLHLYRDENWEKKSFS